VVLAVSVVGGDRRLLKIRNHPVGIGSRLPEAGSRQCVSHAFVSRLKEGTQMVYWQHHLAIIGHSQPQDVGAERQTEDGTDTCAWYV
jgi:hypothetical protein